MKAFALFAVLLLAPAVSGSAGHVVRAHGVALTVPAGWHRVAAAGDGPVIDPTTLLVVGTSGVAARSTQCQIAAYRVPPHGAVIVVVGWRSATSGGGRLKSGREPLEALTSVKRPIFECYFGPGAAASVLLGGRSYQVNVMVGSAATASEIRIALAAARSFRLAKP